LTAGLIRREALAEKHFELPQDDNKITTALTYEGTHRPQAEKAG
jgi:hypothetical protein